MTPTEIPNLSNSKNSLNFINYTYVWSKRIKFFKILFEYFKVPGVPNKGNFLTLNENF